MRNTGKLNVNKTVVLELNYQCNLHCIHCYIPDTEKHPMRFMEYEDATEVLDKLKEYGFRRILITGGEPLLNPDFEKIYSYAWDLGFIISLFTNATLMNKEKMELLVKKRPAMIRISLFGADKHSYERITGQDRYTEVCEKILYLKAQGVNVTVKIPLLRQNDVTKMKEIQREFSAKGISTKIEVRILPRFNGDTEAINYRYTPQEIIDLKIDNEERGEEYYEQIKKLPQKKARNISYCIHVCQPFVINPEMNLQLCFFIREINVNLKENSFENACHLLVEKVSEKYKEETICECLQCDKQYLCPYCPGWAKTEVGKVNEKIPFLCELVKLYEEKYDCLLEHM